MIEPNYDTLHRLCNPLLACSKHANTAPRHSHPPSFKFLTAHLAENRTYWSISLQSVTSFDQSVSFQILSAHANFLSPQRSTRGFVICEPSCFFFSVWELPFCIQCSCHLHPTVYSSNPISPSTVSSWQWVSALVCPARLTGHTRRIQLLPWVDFSYDSYPL